MFTSKSITFFQNNPRQVKVKLRATINNGFKLFVLNNFIRNRLITKFIESYYLTNAKDKLLIHKVRRANIYYKLVASSDDRPLILPNTALAKIF